MRGKILSINPQQQRFDQYQLLAWRAAIKLELKGKKSEEGVTKLIRRSLGMKGSKQKILAEVERLIKEGESNVEVEGLR